MITRNPRILFCEKSLQQRQAIEYFFTDKDIDVYFSEFDGRKVLQDIKDTCPHLAVLEINMPYYDAVAIKSLCRGKPYNPKLFVAHGCHDGGKVVEDVINAGYDRYLLRPYALEILQDMVEKLFNADFSVKAKLPFLEYRADEVLSRLGMPVHVTGYIFLRQGIAMAIDNPMLLNNLTKEMYPRLARLNNTTASCVERSVRNAIKLTWERGNIAEVNRFFCSGINDVWGKPTNGEFIAIISSYIKGEIKKEQIMG